MRAVCLARGNGTAGDRKAIRYAAPLAEVGLDIIEPVECVFDGVQTAQILGAGARP
jgi:hypothetical protein